MKSILSSFALIASSLHCNAADLTSDAANNNAILSLEGAKAVKPVKRTPLIGGNFIVEAEVTKNEQYLFDSRSGTPIKLGPVWKMDPTRQWLVNCGDQGFLAYDLAKQIIFAVVTRLPVTEIIDVGDRASGIVKVRLVDRSVETYSAIHANRKRGWVEEV
jgi:hypothetical protein